MEKKSRRYTAVGPEGGTRGRELALTGAEGHRLTRSPWVDQHRPMETVGDDDADKGEGRHGVAVNSPFNRGGVEVPVRDLISLIVAGWAIGTSGWRRALAKDHADRAHSIQASRRRR